MTPKLKKIILILVVIGILFLVYVMFFKKQDTAEVLISGSNFLNTKNVAETKLLGDQITQALIQIESLKLDRNVIDSSLFKSLIDRSEPILAEPVGRRNPFAPLSDTSVNYTSGVGSGASTSTSTSTSTRNFPNVNNSTTTQRNGSSSDNFLPNTSS